jgi:hypothetical protein
LDFISEQWAQRLEALERHLDSMADAERKTSSRRHEHRE